MSNTPIRVAYLNCRGLSGAAFDSIAAQVPSAFDIFFCAETWYQAPQYYASHPHFLCASPTPPAPVSGRRHGGVLCLISPTLRRHVSFTVTSHSIDLSILGSSLRALYLPPSLPDDVFTSHLRRPIHDSVSGSLPDVLLGDVNVRLGPLVNDTRSGPAGRLSAVMDALPHGGYFMPLPSPGFARNHHVLARPAASVSWSYTDASHLVSTDHKLMSCTFAPRAPLDTTASQEAFRINLRPLEHASIRSELCTYFDLCAEEFAQYSQDQLAAVRAHADNHQLDRYSLQERQAIVDSLDHAISSAIITAASDVCGTYTPSVIRTTVDRFWSSIPEAPSISDAIRCFKRACRAKTVTLTSRDPDITPADDALRHFSKVFTQTNPDFLPPEVSPYRGVSFASEVDFSVDFGMPALLRFWSKYPTHVAGGTDGVHVRLLRVLSDSSLPSRVLELFHICCLLGVTPTLWNRSTIFPIPKKETTTIDTFRPISLTLMMRRSFERLLLAYIKRSPAFRLHPTQAGFRRGFSTLTHAMVAHESAIFGHKYRVFYDFAQAYDTVPVPLLLRKLADRQASSQILALIDSLFLQTSSVVVVNGQQTPSIPLTRGLFQGSLLSPLLFDVFIDDLARLLDEDTDHQSRLPRGLLFADDITAGADALAHLQVTTDKLAAWADANGMVINLAKCGLVGAEPGDPPLMLPGQGPIPVVSSYTYLGFPFEKTGINFESHLEGVTAKATATLQVCRRNGHRWPASVRLAFYRAFVRSQMDYGAGLIHHWLSNSLSRNRSMPFPRINSAETSRYRLLLPLQQLQESALEWITEHSQYLAAHSLVAIPVVTTRFSNLACLLTRHFNRMHHANPAVIMRFRPYFGPRAQDRLLPYVRFHPDLRPWRAADNALQAGNLRPIPAGLTPESTSYPLSLWLRNKFFKDVLSTRQVLPQFFVSDMRRRGVGACHAVHFRSLRLRKNAIAWHLNHFALGSECTVCHKSFHRTHVESCYMPRLANRLPPAIVSEYRSYARPDGTPATFCIVDFLLLRKHYGALATCFGYLELWLRPRSNYAV